METIPDKKLIDDLRAAAKDFDYCCAGARNLYREAAERIEKITRDLRNCRNELCLKCGSYHEAHNMTKSIYERIVEVLDTNCGYVDEEPAEKVAKRIMRAGIIREEKPQAWKVLINALDGTPRYGCPVCKELEWRKTNFCPNCGARMVGEEVGA